MAMISTEAKVVGWTVDQVPCGECREVEYGVRIYVDVGGGETESIWVCGASKPWVRELMETTAPWT